MDTEQAHERLEREYRRLKAEVRYAYPYEDPDFWRNSRRLRALGDIRCTGGTRGLGFDEQDRAWVDALIKDEGRHGQ